MKKLFTVSVCLSLFLMMNSHAGASETKKQSLKLSNGVTYYGEVKNGKPHGRGTMKYSPNKSFEGEWQNGKRNGQGKLVNTEIIKVEPSGSEDVYSNKSREIEVYKGTWLNDQFSGSGLHTYSSVFKEFNTDENNVKTERFMDFTYRAEKGVFRNSKLISGYSGAWSKDSSDLSYIDSKVSFSMFSDRDWHMTNLAWSEFTHLDYIGYSKKVNQSDYNLTIYQNEIREGTFSKDQIVNGTTIYNNSNSSYYTYMKEDYKNGAVFNGQELNYEKFSDTRNKYLEKYVSLIKPYSKGLYDLTAILISLEKENN